MQKVRSFLAYTVFALFLNWRVFFFFHISENARHLKLSSMVSFLADQCLFRRSCLSGYQTVPGAPKRLDEAWDPSTSMTYTNPFGTLLLSPNDKMDVSEDADDVDHPISKKRSVETGEDNMRELTDREGQGKFTVNGKIDFALHVQISYRQ